MSWVRFAGVVLGLAVVGGAHADVKIDTKFSVSGGPNGGTENVLHIRQHGAATRVDFERDGKWILLDGATKYVVDPSNKTYWVLTRKAPQAGGDGERNLTCTKSTETKEISGIPVTKFNVSGSITLSGGTRQAGGGQAAARRRGAGRSGSSMKLGVSGVLWGAGMFADQGLDFEDFMPASGSMSRSSGLTGGLAEVGVPLEGRISIQIPGRRGSGQSIAMQFETTSVSKEAQDASAFSVPQDFRKVDPPERPQRGK